MRILAILLVLLLQIACAQQQSDSVDEIMWSCIEQNLEENDPNFNERLSNFEQELIDQGVLESADGIGYYGFYEDIVETNSFPSPVLSGTLDTLFSAYPNAIYSEECLTKLASVDSSLLIESSFFKIVIAIDSLNATQNLSPTKMASIITTNLSHHDFNTPLFRYLSLYVLYKFGRYNSNDGILRTLPPPKENTNEDDYKEIHVWLSENDKLLMDGQPISEAELRMKLRKFILKSPQFNRTILHLHGETSYLFYVQTQDLIESIYLDIRNEESKERFSQPFDQLSESEQKEIVKSYPKNIWEAESYK